MTDFDGAGGRGAAAAAETVDGTSKKGRTNWQQPGFDAELASSSGLRLEELQRA